MEVGRKKNKSEDHWVSVRFLSQAAISSMICCLLRLTVLSMMRILPLSFSFPTFNHSSCLRWICYRQSNGMSSSPLRSRFLILYWQVWGLHCTQMMPSRPMMPLVLTRWSQNWRQMECSASSRMWVSRIILAKILRSERRERSEIRMPLPTIWLYSIHLLSLLIKAQIWKVKPQRAWSLQYSSRRLMFFFSPTFCQSERGSSRMVSSGKFSLIIFRIVDLPLPILPSIEMNFGFSCILAVSAILKQLRIASPLKLTINTYIFKTTPSPISKSISHLFHNHLIRSIVGPEQGPAHEPQPLFFCAAPPRRMRCNSPFPQCIWCSQLGCRV